MKYILRIWFLSLLPIVSAGCGGDSTENPDLAPNPPAPPATEDTIVFADDTPPAPVLSGEGGKAAIRFTASSDWTAAVKDRIRSETNCTRAASDWLAVSPASGAAGTVTVRVTAAANDGPATRSAAVVIRCGKESVEITISQQPNAKAAAEAEIPRTAHTALSGYRRRQLDPQRQLVFRQADFGVVRGGIRERGIVVGFFWRFN